MIRSRPPRLVLAGLAAVAALLMAAACTSAPSRKKATPTPKPTSGVTASPLAPAPVTAAPCGSRRHPPRTYDHVVWVVLENHTFSDIIGNDQAPYLNRLATRCGLATNFFAEAHPSLPNYIAMTSGSTQGVDDDAGPRKHPLSVPNIFAQTDGDWRGLAESMPEPCARSGSGNYAPRHNPAVYFVNLHDCTARDVPLGPVPDLSAKFTFITPNLCHTMHPCDATGAERRLSQVERGDRWLAQEVPLLLASPEYRAGKTVIVITFDEGDGGDQRIPTWVLSPYTKPGTRAGARFDHYALLRTTEDLLGLDGHIGAAARAPSMRSAFGL